MKTEVHGNLTGVRDSLIANLQGLYQYEVEEDAFLPRELNSAALEQDLTFVGLLGMIGKGKRGPEVIDAMREAGAVYFGAIGGAGALLSRRVRSAELVCYEDLGAEAVRRLEVEDLPLTVVIDSLGNNLYETGLAAYLKRRNSPEK